MYVCLLLTINTSYLNHLTKKAQIGHLIMLYIYAMPANFQGRANGETLKNIANKLRAFP